MKNFRRLIFFLIAAVAIIMVPSCSNYKNIKIDSCRVSSFSPVGMRSADVVLQAVVDNPAPKIQVLEAKGVIEKDGRELATAQVEPFEIPKKCVGEKLEVNGTIEVSASLSLFEVMAIVSNFNPAGMVADLELKIKTGGVAKTLRFNDMPLEDLINTVESGQFSNLLSL